MAPKQPCPVPGCPNLKARGARYCDAHRGRQWKNDTRQNFRERGYGTAWDKLKAMKKAQDPLCEMCLKEGGRVKPVEIVHHIKPVEEGGEMLDMDNLMSVCRQHHGELHSKGEGGS